MGEKSQCKIIHLSNNMNLQIIIYDCGNLWAWRASQQPNPV